MTIKIAFNNANGDSKGINFTAYLNAFEKNFESTGYGGFSGTTMGEATSQNNPLSAGAYATTDSENGGGQSVIFDAAGKFIYDFYNGHVISGKLSSLSFGNNTVVDKVDDDTTNYSNSEDIRISGFSNYSTSTSDGQILGDIMDSKTSSLLSYLNKQKIDFEGSTGADTFTAFAKADTLWGGRGNDKLGGAAGADVLDGDRGSDVLSGGAGADTFQFSKGDGRDRITDFQAGKANADVIAFDGLFSDYKDMLGSVTDTKDGLRIVYDGGSVFMEDLDLKDLHKNDFDF